MMISYDTINSVIRQVHNNIMHKGKEFLMSNVRRVYVEKKPAFAVQAKELKHEISSYLGIKSATEVRVLIRYDVENISDEVFEKACKTVFAEPPVDDLYLEKFEAAEFFL